MPPEPISAALTQSAPEPTETYDVLCDLLFEWSTPHQDDSLIGLAGHVLDYDDHILARLHELRNELHVLIDLRPRVPHKR